MKKLMLSAIIICIAVSTFAAKNFYTASLYLNNGTIKSGLATFVDYESGVYIGFKAKNDSEVEKIESIQIKKIIYTFEEEEFEFVYSKVYKGWKQIEIKGPIWLEVVKKGVASLYVVKTIVEGGVMPTNRTSVTFRDYYIMRDGEPAAKLIATIASANNNQTFRAKAPLYFADYPELATKIKNKEYTWRNLEEVVDIYNNWAKQQKK